MVLLAFHRPPPPSPPPPVQLAGRGQNVFYTSYLVLKDEGPLAMYRGVTAAVARGMLYGGALWGAGAGAGSLQLQRGGWRRRGAGRRDGLSFVLKCLGAGACMLLKTEAKRGVGVGKYRSKAAQYVPIHKSNLAASQDSTWVFNTPVSYS